MVGGEHLAGHQVQRRPDNALAVVSRLRREAVSQRQGVAVARYQRARAGRIAEGNYSYRAKAKKGRKICFQEEYELSGPGFL